jgi:hypothetical protein
VKKIIAILITAILFGCQDTPKDPKTGDVPVEQPSYTMQFNADSAYAFVEAQVQFGPRVPGTIEHGLTANYLNRKLEVYCDTSFIQKVQITTAEGAPLEIKNIIGSFKPKKAKRILLCAHWDTRPLADEDKDDPNSPADGANDGASGVGVLLEIARQLQTQRPELGVDIVFFDAEDMGTRGGGNTSWCLGSQYWAKNPHVKGYNAEYGILLDMVGAQDAVFLFEQHSLSQAKWLLQKVWKNASGLGHHKYFRSFEGGFITDDHYFISTLAGIPTIDIIHYDQNTGSGFGDFWHTHGDNMDGIDAKTLKAVGETVLKTVWEQR